MTRNLKVFIGLSVLSTAIYMAANDLTDHLSGAAQNIASWALLILSIWAAFDLVVKVIYRLAGISKKLMDSAPPRLSHQEAATVSRFWTAWLLTSVFTATTYTLLFQRDQWKATIVVSGVLLFAVLLANINRRQLLMGHTKKDLFK